MKPEAGMRQGAAARVSKPPAVEAAARPGGSAPAAAPDPWADAHVAAVLLAVNPQGLGGVRLRGAPGQTRDDWLQRYRAACPPGMPWQRLPLHTDDDRLLGGLDLGATLQRGTVVLQQGLLARTDGGVLLVAMAERMSPTLAAKLAAVLDTGSVALQRSGTAACAPARLAVVALDEGEAGEAGEVGGGAMGDSETPPQALLERLAFRINLNALPRPEGSASLMPDGPAPAAVSQAAAAVAAARERLHQVQCSEELLQALCEAALALGVAGLRASLFALAAARAHAAWCGRVEVTVEDAAVAARLVLSPRATRLPAAEEENAPPPEATDETAGEEEQPPEDPAADEEPPPPETGEPDEPQNLDQESPVEASVQDQVLQAAQAAIPQGLLELLAGSAARSPAGAGGRAGALQQSRLRGRPYGSRRGDPRTGARLHLIDTLRAAAPWQLLRRREQAALQAATRGAATAASTSALTAASTAAMSAAKGSATGSATGSAKQDAQSAAQPAPGPVVLVRRDDFHVSRFRQRRETTTLFIVDASGSAALHRLAEAKGAVELLLADCYVRRDSVALLAFRGAVGAELLLPPTRSLVRAKRSLAAMAGGGGTPLAAALDHAQGLMQSIIRKGGTPLAVLLTDGRANIARDGSPGRERAHADALASARQWQASGLGALWLDTAPQPQPLAQQIALAMGARYLPLPLADARQVQRAVTALR